MNKPIGIRFNFLPHINGVEADILRVMWDYGSPLTANDIIRVSKVMQTPIDPLYMQGVRLAARSLVRKKIIKSIVPDEGNIRIVLYSPRFTREQIVDAVVADVKDRLGDTR